MGAKGLLQTVSVIQDDVICIEIGASENVSWPIFAAAPSFNRLETEV